MAKYILTFVVGGLFGLAAGFAVGIFAYPYIFLADIVAADKIENAGARTVIAKGTFIHANPSDPIHHGKGGVTVYADLVHLEGDFEVGPGPKYHVYLVPDKDVTPSTEVARTMFVDLGRLRAFKGSQNYPIPAGVNLAGYKSAVIWCEQFGVLISPAALKLQ
ncbi:MAG TPA: DM13 domain-containing protein [Gemmatimonadaceae bacterium]